MRSRNAMSSRITSGIGHEQVRGPHHHLDRLVGVAEHGDGGHARQGVLAPGEGAGLAVGLQRGHDLLGHLLEVGHLVEGDGVPDADQAHLAGRHVVEEIGDRRRPGQQDRVGGQLLVGVALARAARPKLHEVVVVLAQREQPDQEEQLQPPVEVRRLQADAADQQVDPLVGGELAAALAVLVQVEGGQLDRLAAPRSRTGCACPSPPRRTGAGCPPAPRCRPSAAGRTPGRSAPGCGRTCGRS